MFSLRLLLRFSDDEYSGDMARRRFFVPAVRRGVAELTGDDAEHLVRVLRAEVDQVYEISDNESLFLARITAARKSIVSFEVIEQLPVPVRLGRTTLIAALFKFDHFEWLVEKATELGVDEVIPFEAVRTERGLMHASAKRRTRWERIALEASQQSRRVHLPVVAHAISYLEAAKTAATTKIILDEDPGTPSILRVLPTSPPASFHVAMLLGPEGGWTSEERSHALSVGWLRASLGVTVLRAETAGIAGLSIIRAWAS